MVHLIFVTKYRKKDRNNLKLHCKIAPKGGRSFLIKSVKLAPFAEGDAILKILIYLALQFQSAPSLRKVTTSHGIYGNGRLISIHTFLAEGDHPGIPLDLQNSNFNPHLPCGRWQVRCRNYKMLGKFQSTPSLRKVTRNSKDESCGMDISIHTFLAEGDEDRKSVV